MSEPERNHCAIINSYDKLFLELPFEPVKFGLKFDFNLKDYRNIENLNLINAPDSFRNIKIYFNETNPNAFSEDNCKISCSVKTIETENLFLMQSTSFIYPMINSPYTMGKILCAHILNGLYGIGVTKIDNVRLNLMLANDMLDKERDVVGGLIIRGFKAMEANARFNGFTPILNPCCLFGATATSLSSHFDRKVSRQPLLQDQIILTKALGATYTINSYDSLCTTENYKILKSVATRVQIDDAYYMAVKCIQQLNFHAANLMEKLGLMGHAELMASVQSEKITFEIHHIPVIAKIADVAKQMSYENLGNGTSPETSGGLLICMSKANARQFCTDIREINGFHSWVVGQVVPGENNAKLYNFARVLDVVL